MNQTKVIFNACGGVKTSPLYQYDYGQELVFEGFDLPASFEVQFSNTIDGVSVTQIGADNIVTIPDAMLQSGASVYAWLFLHTGEDDGETEYYVEIPVIERAEPSDDQPTPVEQSAITEAIAALNAGVSAAEGYAASAQAALNAILAAGISATDDGNGNVTLSLEVNNNA